MTETTKVDATHITWEEIATVTAHHDEDPLYTAQEFADELRVSLRTALDLLRGGALPAAKVGGQWRVTRSAIDKFLNRQRRAPEVISIAYKDPSKHRLVIVGPSGSGKSRIAEELRAQHPDAQIEEVQVHCGDPQLGKGQLLDELRRLWAAEPGETTRGALRASANEMRMASSVTVQPAALDLDGAAGPMPHRGVA